MKLSGLRATISCCIGIFLLVFLFTGCASRRPVVYERRIPPQRFEKRETLVVQYGVASWYGPDFHGKPTSSGEIYDIPAHLCSQLLPSGEHGHGHQPGKREVRRAQGQ